MKIRIKDNTVRIRLTKSEVASLSENGRIISKTEFLNKDFVYGIEILYQEGLSISFEDEEMMVQMPKSYVEEWVNTDRVTFEETHNKILILLEKDFVCIDRPEEDQSDNYPNPNLVC